MVKIILVVSSLFFISLNIKAQSPLPPVYKIIADTSNVQLVDSTFWQKLEDKEGKWTFEEVSKEPLAGKFHIKGTYAAGVDTSDVHTYWHRYRFKNTMSQEAKISLTSPVDFFDVYIIKKDSSVSHYRSGFLRNWEEKDGLKIAHAIPLVLKPGEVITVYDRRHRKFDNNFRTSVRYLSTDKLEQKYIETVHERSNIYSKLHLQETFMLGMLFLSAVFSFFLFRVTREKVYIYFAFFVFFLAINRHWNIAEAYTKWYKPDWLAYVSYIGYAWIFIPFFLVLFIRNFFDCKTRYPKWNKVLISIGWLQLAIGLLDFILRMANHNLSNLVYRVNSVIAFLLIPLAILITSLLYLHIKVQSYRFVAIGVLPYMLFYIAAALIGPETVFWDTSSLALSKWLGDNFRLLEMITLGLLITCFSWVLFLHFIQLRKENEQQALEKERLAMEKEVERNELIEKQKMQLEKDVEERTSELMKSLEDLKSTQAQLIQSEKMASLGELTAGIAHEIQNPLNFVNNFSEVNKELLAELKGEIRKGNIDEVNALADDVISNEEKINQHGQRASSIVKGMLEHSRKSSGEKTPTDINALCDEYLRLSYHGLRAKDKSFNADYKMDLDPNMPKINVVSQDIARVLLNIINNAFQACHEKSGSLKTESREDYKPCVTITTKYVSKGTSASRPETSGCEISVTDNGSGITDSVKDKIFQPFFTTKPTGQGTGLGLSLAYDIVKAHGGNLVVKSTEGVGSEFVITLPLKNNG